MFTKKIIIKSEKDTINLAKKIGPLLKKKDIVALNGDLGAGKTFFSRALIRNLSNNDNQEVPSPTFTLVQFYDLPEFTLWHFDLYRIKHPEEVYDLGWEDACYDGVVLVEWPQKLEHLTPKDRLEIEISFEENSSNRIALIKGHGEMEERLNGIDL